MCACHSKSVELRRQPQLPSLTSTLFHRIFLFSPGHGRLASLGASRDLLTTGTPALPTCWPHLSLVGSGDLNTGPPLLHGKCFTHSLRHLSSAWHVETLWTRKNVTKVEPVMWCDLPGSLLNLVLSPFFFLRVLFRCVSILNNCLCYIPKFLGSTKCVQLSKFLP